MATPKDREREGREHADKPGEGRRDAKDISNKEKDFSNKDFPNKNKGQGQGPGQGDMTVREAGKMGGDARKEQLGPEGYSELGKMGGQKGGEARKQELGPEGYSDLGKKGGQRVRDLIDESKRGEGEGGSEDVSTSK